VIAPFSVAALTQRAVMGVVNVTPDSFSDGGRYLASDAAIVHGRELALEGAAVIDVGGESTRPGATPVAADDEVARIEPVVRALAAELTVPVSIDTTKTVVAEAALAAGATIVNDVSGGTAEPDILRVVAAADAGFIAMHMRGTPRTMQDDPRYDDVVVEVGDELRRRVDAALAVGVRAEAIMADPGIGFGKTVEHNLALLRALPVLAERVGVPLVLGTSRKSFLAKVLGDTSLEARDDATLGTTVWCFAHGAAMVRVHDVAASVRAAQLIDVMERSTQDGVVAA
jgi:dihydropteroate synthase